MSRERIDQHYRDRIRDDADGADIVDWASPAHQQIRFDTLIDHVPLAGRSLLDVGCGVGDLLGRLAERAVECDYLGIDLLDAMTAQAQKRYPHGRFHTLDIFADPCPLPAESFDVVFASGTFNLHLDNHHAFLTRAIERMLLLARDVVAFNLLHVRSPVHCGYCAYFRPDDVLAMIAGMGCTVRIVDDYLPNDFTIICTKN
jgi:SAM-dependent methyltransferase